MEGWNTKSIKQEGVGEDDKGEKKSVHVASNGIFVLENVCVVWLREPHKKNV